MDMKEIEKAVSEVMQVPIEAMHGKTRKAAETYRVNNARVLSLKEVGQAFENEHFEDAIEYLEEIVKSRL